MTPAMAREVKGSSTNQAPTPTLFGQLSVLEDARPVTLTFRSKDDAHQFLDFVRLAIMETGIGNGYGGYWPSSEVPLGVDTAVPSPLINRKFIEDMAQAICNVRMGRDSWDKRPPEYVPSIGREGGVNVFEFDRGLLPARPVPATGDLAVVVDHDGIRGRGRVLSIEGEVAVLCAEENSPLRMQDEQIPGGQSVHVPLICLMKIREAAS